MTEPAYLEASAEIAAHRKELALLHEKAKRGNDPPAATSLIGQDEVRDEVPYEVLGVESRTATIAEVGLSPLAEPIAYLPGQYVLLADPDRRLAPRSYSAANAPRPDGAISLLVTRVPGGQTSGWVHERLAAGDRVSLSGPYGSFLADPSATAPALHLAAGSGLAPIRALVEAALAVDQPRPLKVIFSARTEADVLDRERFACLQATYPRFRYLRTLTRGAGPAPHGRIPALLRELGGDLAGSDVFIAGASGFVLDCAAAAEAAGAARAQVHTEVFFAEPQPWTGRPPAAPGSD